MASRAEARDSPVGSVIESDACTRWLSPSDSRSFARCVSRSHACKAARCPSLSALAAGGRARTRERPLLHRQESERTPLVPSRRHDREGRRQGLLAAGDHLHTKFARPHQQKRAAQAREPPVLLPYREPLGGVGELPRDDPREQIEPLGARLAVSQQLVHRRGEGIVRYGRGLDGPFCRGRLRRRACRSFALAAGEAKKEEGGYRRNREEVRSIRERHLETVAFAG